ncbi:hypothetical protein [Halomonas organivorans]|uniref:Uncharacterized protein n=1 Tax=Halomonas organivorans TaxID=257772 RepID=A0A7W5C190_9GAMM|nr:hypothetical protein [Halomonas organivorans]MBB3142875.1 hypothetical protein [Halomonas organivorans]
MKSLYFHDYARFGISKMPKKGCRLNTPLTGKSLLTKKEIDTLCRNGDPFPSDRLWRKKYPLIETLPMEALEHALYVLDDAPRLTPPAFCASLRCVLRYISRQSESTPSQGSALPGKERDGENAT